MADAHGGYHAPQSPAAVSGPGKFAKRTDSQPVTDIPNAAYGEQAAFRSIQQGAPMAVGQSTPPVGASNGGAPPGVTPLTAPSQRPNEPVTSGADLGAGPTSAVLGIPSTPQAQRSRDSQDLQPALQAMISYAESEHASAGFRRYVREVIANS